MSRRTIIILFIIGGVIVPVGLIVLLNRMITVSQWESNAPTSASYSADDAKKAGNFVRRVHISPDHIIHRGQKIALKDAWIERVHDLEVTLLFSESKTFRDEYRLVVLPDMLSSDNDNITLKDQTRRYFAHESSGKGKPFALTYDLGKDYPDTLRCRVVSDRKVTDSVVTMMLRPPGE